MLHLDADRVRLDRAQPGDSRPIEEILPLMTAGGVGAVSPNGVLGDPSGSTPGDECGESIDSAPLRVTNAASR